MIRKIRSAIFAWNWRCSSAKALKAAHARSEKARAAYQNASARKDTRAMCATLRDLTTAVHDELRLSA